MQKKKKEGGEKLKALRKKWGRLLDCSLPRHKCANIKWSNAQAALSKIIK